MMDVSWLAGLLGTGNTVQSDYQQPISQIVKISYLAALESGIPVMTHLFISATPSRQLTLRVPQCSPPSIG